MDRDGKRKIHRIAWYSVLHLLVDGVCAMAMFGRFSREEGGYFFLLLYNFCAFALQMPLGVLLDAVLAAGKGGEDKRTDYAFLTAAAGIICTLAGAVTHPVVLGIGNALFHVGGGVGTIYEDRREQWRGRGLGVFVSPGAVGLYLGTLLGKGDSWEASLLWTGIVMILLCGAEMCRTRRYARLSEPIREDRLEARSDTVQKAWKKSGLKKMQEVREGFRTGSGRDEWGRAAVKENGRKDDMKGLIRAAVICTTVVILRSYIGMAVAFPWKTGIAAGILAVLAVACGKAAGGFAAARWGFQKTVTASLSLAALCYLFSVHMPLGLAAAFLFNMTMPLTLYEMVCLIPDRPGLSFGLLTFALFLGFLPGYLGFLPSAAGGIPGGAGSLLTLFLLLAAGIGGTDFTAKCRGRQLAAETEGRRE